METGSRHLRSFLKVESLGILKLYYKTTRFRIRSMLRKADTAKFRKLNLKLKTLNLKPYTDKWEPEGLTSEVLQG